MDMKRHRYRNGKPTTIFDGLSYKEQAQSINMTKVNLKKMVAAHKRKGKEEGKWFKLAETTCHICESRYPVVYRIVWIPAFRNGLYASLRVAGMTKEYGEDKDESKR